MESPISGDRCRRRYVLSLVSGSRQMSYLSTRHTAVSGDTIASSLLMKIRLQPALRPMLSLPSTFVAQGEILTFRFLIHHTQTDGDRYRCLMMNSGHQ